MPELFARAPWWVFPLVLIAVDYGILIAADAYHAPAGMGRNFVVVASVAIGFAGLTGLSTRRARRRLLRNTDRLAVIASLHPLAFEELVLAAYLNHGWSGSLTRNGPDGGVDIILRKGGSVTYVQCKRWLTRAIPVDAVRALKGSMATEGVANGIFVSAGRFTPESVRYAASSGIILVDGDGLLELIREVTATRGGSASPTEPGPAPKSTTSGTTTGLARPGPEAASGARSPILPHIGPPSGQPDCPRCKERMVRRSGSHGPFWGCPHFPKCRGTRQIAAGGR